MAEAIEGAERDAGLRVDDVASAQAVAGMIEHFRRDRVMGGIIAGVL